MLKHMVLTAGLALGTTTASAAETELWRLDCGNIAVADMAAFSDTFAGAGETGELTNSCYLIRHDGDYLLWDAGFPEALLGQEMQAGPLTASLQVTLAEQLATLGIAPETISRIGVSHYHFDHIGQAAIAPGAELMIAAADLALLKTPGAPFAEPGLIAPWLDGGRVTEVRGDLDVYGDGTVTMLAMPGHTPGSMALLVRLADTGPVLLSGDVVHFETQLERDGVPLFNTDRADSLASMARLRGLAAATGATLVVQHDPSDVTRLPAFPASAR